MCVSPNRNKGRELCLRAPTPRRVLGSDGGEVKGELRAGKWREKRSKDKWTRWGFRICCGNGNLSGHQCVGQNKNICDCDDLQERERTKKRSKNNSKSTQQQQKLENKTPKKPKRNIESQKKRPCRCLLVPPDHNHPRRLCFSVCV